MIKRIPWTMIDPDAKHELSIEMQIDDINDLYLWTNGREIYYDDWHYKLEWLPDRPFAIIVPYKDTSIKESDLLSLLEEVINDS